MTSSLSTPTREPILVLADIIKSELELTDTEDSKGNTISPVMIYNQKYIIPTTKGLFVALSIVSQKVIGSKNSTQPTTGGMQETQELSISTLIQIDAMSRNEQARTRKDEIIMALSSIFSQQAQDTYGMRIAQIPISWLDASAIEGTAILNRYSTTVTIYSITRKIKAMTSYYDDFDEPPELHYDPKTV
jgi:hypothetical protein